MKFGLIGYPLSHSFSPAYFNDKFKQAGLHDFSYTLLPVKADSDIHAILRSDYFGLNVTIPHKSAVLNYLNDIDPIALKIGAVNTIVRTGKYSWKGFNTDVSGFTESLMEWYGSNALPMKALILGSGGSAKAVGYALLQLGITTSVVSRSSLGKYNYNELTPEILKDHRLIINTTPLGMTPDASTCPSIPYDHITREHRVFDLIYNPLNTLFLSRCEANGALIKNGLDMLHRQADHAWLIWKRYGKF
jgi:shikimate dehydrogenase